MDMDLAWCPVCEKQILPELITIVRPRVASAHPKPIIPEYPAPQQQPTQAAVDPVMQAPPPTPVVRKVAFAANPVTQTRRVAGGHGLVHGTGRGPAVRATVAARKKQAQIAQAALLAQQQLLIAQQQQQAQAQAAAARAAAMEPEVVTEFSSAPPPLYCSEACREKDLDNTSFVFPSTSPPTAFRRLSSGSESEGSSGKLQSSSSESSLYEHGGVGATRQFMQRIPSSASVASSSAATASSGRSSSGGFINDPLNFTRTKQRARKALQMTTSSFTAVPCVKGLTVDERWKRKEEEQDKEMARWKIERLRRECDELNLGCDEAPAPVDEVKPTKATTRARKPSRPALLLSSSPSAASTSTSTVDVLSRTSSCQSIAVNGVSPEDRSPIYGTVPRKPRRAASTTSSSTRSRSPSSPLATTSPTTPTSDADSISAFKRDPNHDAWSWEDAKDKSTLLYDVDPAMLTCFDNKRLWNFTREKMGVWKRPEGEEGLKTLVGAGEVREEKPVGWGKMGLGRNSTSSSAWLRSH